MDQPFLFYIYDHQNNIPLFVGRIVDPGGNQKLAKAEPIIVKAHALPNCDESGYDPTTSGQVINLNERPDQLTILPILYNYKLLSQCDLIRNVV